MIKRIEGAAGWLAYLIWLIGSWVLAGASVLALINGQWLGYLALIAIPCALYMTLNRRDFMGERNEG